MNRKTYLAVMVGVTMVYGAVIAIIAMLGMENLGVIAAIGAIVLGLGWSLLGVLSKTDSTS